MSSLRIKVFTVKRVVSSFWCQVQVFILRIFLIVDWWHPAVSWLGRRAGGGSCEYDRFLSVFPLYNIDGGCPPSTDTLIIDRKKTLTTKEGIRGEFQVQHPAVIISDYISFLMLTVPHYMSLTLANSSERIGFLSADLISFVFLEMSLSWRDKCWAAFVYVLMTRNCRIAQRGPETRGRVFTALTVCSRDLSKQNRYHPERH